MVIESGTFGCSDIEYHYHVAILDDQLVRGIQTKNVQDLMQSPRWWMWEAKPPTNTGVQGGAKLLQKNEIFFLSEFFFGQMLFFDQKWSKKYFMLRF